VKNSVAYDAPMDPYDAGYAAGRLFGVMCFLGFGLAVIGGIIWAIIYFARKQSKPPVANPPAGQPPYPYQRPPAPQPPAPQPSPTQNPPGPPGPPQ